MSTDTVQLIRNDPWRMECLRAVESMRLRDWYMAAGFLRNAIWDALHDNSTRTPLNDVDVVYYDPVDVGTATEAQIEAALRTMFPDAQWEVRNQARMHLRNGHASYRNCDHAIAHWIETPTCVGVRIEPNEMLKIVAPHGIAENWSLRVAPNPLIRYPGAVFNERGRKKGWLEQWPKLRVEWAREVPPSRRHHDSAR